MTALTDTRDTKWQETERLVSLPVKAGAVIFAGAIVCTDATGYAVPASTSTALRAVGRAEETVDNTNGASGDLYITARRGVFKYANSAAADEIAITERFTQCYLVDDQTVAKTSGSATRSRAGLVWDVEADGVWVLIGAELQAEVASLEAGALQKRSVTITHDNQLDVASTSATVAIGAALPANSRVIGTSIHTVTPVAGGTISACVVDIGSAGDVDAIVDGADVFASAVDGQAATRPAGIAPNKLFASPTQLNAVVTSTDGNLEDATAGAFTIDVLFQVLA